MNKPSGLRDWETILAGIAGLRNPAYWRPSWISSDVNHPTELIKLPLADLRVCPRKHQAVMLHAISPISMTYYFTLPTPTLKQTKWFLLWLFPGKDRSPVFLGFHKGNRLKIPKSMNHRFIQIFYNFEVKYLPSPESRNNNIIPYVIHYFIAKNHQKNLVTFIPCL